MALVTPIMLRGAARLVLLMAVICGVSGRAYADATDLTVYSPIVEQGEFAIETRGNVTFDNNRSRDGAQNYHHEIEFTPLSFWHTALIGTMFKDPEGSLKYDATGWENIFQLFPQGEHWLDLGLYVEYESAKQRGAADTLEWKILAEKDVGRLTFTVNPIFEKEVGDNASKTTEFKYAARVKWRLMPEIEPAIEAYGDVGEIRRLDPTNEQRHQIGPVLLGKFRLGNTSALRYEAGYLFGLTGGGSPDGAFKWLLELEHYF